MLVKMMKSYFMVKQKSASKSGEIERMAVFPDSRAMLYPTPGKLCSLSTSTASRTPHKQNIRPDPLVKPSSPAVQSNESHCIGDHPQTARDGTVPSSPLLRTAGATCSSSTSSTSPSSPRSSPTIQHQAVTPPQNIHKKEFVFRWSSMSTSVLAMEIWIVNVDVV